MYRESTKRIGGNKMLNGRYVSYSVVIARKKVLNLLSDGRFRSLNKIAFECKLDVDLVQDVRQFGGLPILRRPIKGKFAYIMLYGLDINKC